MKSCILGDPGAVSEGGKNSGEEKSRMKIRALNFILDFSSPEFFPPPLTAPGSPRMEKLGCSTKMVQLKTDVACIN